VTQGAATPKAVLLLFHGCSHSATDWWHASKNCPSCLGAPARGPLTQREGWGAALRGLLDTESCAVACVGRAWLIAACKPSARCPLRGAAQPALQAAAGCNSTPHRSLVPQAAAAPRISCLFPGQRLARRTACTRHATRMVTLAPRRGRARRRAARPRARAARASGAPRRCSDKVSAENHPRKAWALRGPQACRRRWASRAQRCGAAGRRSPFPAPTASSAAGTCARRGARRRPRATSPRRAPARRARLRRSSGALLP